MKPLAPLSAEWPAISALLDEALALPRSAQARWLDSLRGDRAAHRAVLAALLGQRAGVETDDFLAAPPALDPALFGAPPGDGLKPGSRVGAYRLVEPLGQGGMGTVWLAERADGLVQRRVALKLPRAVWGGDFAERLAREQRILATLEHAHIARLYDAGLDGEGRPFLAMEFVEGVPIDVHCRDRSLPLRARLELLLQVFAAVSHAHSKLVVHRDLKPGNILVTAAGEVKLLDFGIAKLLEGDRTRRTALTEFAGRALTLDYASPEQIRGAPLGTTSDVYSLGVVAYELLAEARPYRLERGSAARLEAAIETVQPLRASDAAPRPALRQQLRGDLDAILNKALKKEAAARYQSVDAFAQDLARWLAGEPVQARPDSRRYRTAKFVARHRFGVAMGTALAASVVAGAGVSLWQAREARAQAARAEAEVVGQRAVRDLYMETMMALSVLGQTAPAALARPHAVDGALQAKLGEIGPRFDAKPSGREAQLEAVMLQLNYNGDFEGSLAVGRQYLEQLQKNGRPADRVIEAYATLGRTLFQLQRYDECQAMRRAAVAWAPEAVDPAAVVARVSVMADLGSVYTARGRRYEAEAVLLDAEALLRRAFPGQRVYSEVSQQLANLYLGFDDAKALEKARAGAEAMRAESSLDPGQRAAALLSLGGAQLAAGRAAEAEASLREAQSLFVAAFGPANRNAVRAVGRRAGAVSRQGDFARAAALLADARAAIAALPTGLTPFADVTLRGREIETAWLAGDTRAAAGLSVAAARPLLAAAIVRDSDFLVVAESRLLVLAGRAGEAVELLEALQRSTPDAGRPSAGWIQQCEALAVAQLAAGAANAGERTARDLLALLERHRAASGRAGRNAAELVALAAARSGDPADAARALALAQSGAPPPFGSAVERAESALRRAEVLGRLGRVDEAAAAGRSALADLAGQHPDSPRLAQARRLAGPSVVAAR